MFTPDETPKSGKVIAWSFMRKLSAAVIFYGLSFSMGLAASPVGYLDGIDAGWRVWGWTADADTPGKTLAVHLYLDGPAGSGRLVAAIPADKPRADVTEVAGFPGSHGFEWIVPQPYRVGRHHLYAYGIDSSGAGVNPLLGHSPLSLGIYTYGSGSLLYLDNGRERVGVDMRRGGMITEISHRGANLVNGYDTGRAIQAAFYDGNHRYDSFAASGGGVYGWNPVQGGDRYNKSSPVVDYELGLNFIRTRTLLLEWNPDGKGGGRYRTVPTDILLDQTISFDVNNADVIDVTYRLTHLGNDRHAVHFQELPAVYLNKEFNRVVAYSGSRPWLNDEVQFITPPLLSQYAAPFATTERWVGLVDERGRGLVVFDPTAGLNAVSLQIPEGGGGPTGSAANFVRHVTDFAIPPRAVIGKTVKLIPGHYQKARQIIYRLRAAYGL